MYFNINKLNFDAPQDYDFLEIGTCYFDTLIEKSTIEKGISVEPIKQYLDMLPDKQNVIKLNAAIICEENKDKDLLIYYVEPEDCIKYNLGNWLLGCNKIGEPHDFHTGYYPDPGAWHENEEIRKSKNNKRNLLDEGIVKTKKVTTYTFLELVKKFNINKIKLLKIDTEGYDCKILNDVLDYYENTNSLNYPTRIMFECNKHNDQTEVENMLRKISNLNYDIKIIEQGNAVVATRRKNGNI